MELPKKLMDEIWEYCRVNKITDVDGFILKMFNQGFTVEKFGATPTERIVEKEVEKIVEVIKEVEVEKEVEVIKEIIKHVPVEVIKEIEVIKEVKVTDNAEMQKLIDKNNILENDIKTIQEAHETISHELGKRGETITKLTQELNDQGGLKEKHDTLMTKLGAEIKRLNEELEIEKGKNKRDIYGEN